MQKTRLRNEEFAQEENDVKSRRSGGNSRSPFGPVGNLLFSEAATGTVPVFSICSSRLACSRAARSASSSSSSMGSVMGIEVIALPISCVSSCCSRSCSLLSRRCWLFFALQLFQGGMECI